MKTIDKNPCFLAFSQKIEHYSLPQKFTFPFYYQPHPLAILAAQDLQNYLQNQTEWQHNFGLQANQEGLIIGKMFGVLVVQNAQNELGFLAAFSGKLGNSNQHRFFVPPVYDMLVENSFFNQGKAHLIELTQTLTDLENSAELAQSKHFFEQEKQLFDQEIEAHKEKMRIAKQDRKTRRTQAQNTLQATDFTQFCEILAKESLNYQYQLTHLSKYWQARLFLAQEKLDHFTQKIAHLKQLRKQISNQLQQRLFDEYNFLNEAGELKNVCEIFENTAQKIPPAAAGECAAPKLLQYAFKHQLKPIALAEFWWGQSPSDEIRKHLQFYPACRGKCEPILAHMLQGIPLEENPMLINPAEGKTIQIVHQDDDMLVINKPAEFLSVPGKNIEDSVWLRMKHLFPNATGPLIVHRLDMSTSGVMLIAKTKEANKILQAQFIERTIKKQYTALLEGIVHQNEGVIDLPLRTDIDDRPRQMVCYQHGKWAKTAYKVLERKNGKTKIQFFPITGRTHQLRMHAAHPKGLNMPIVGDDLYGTKADRLHLHAQFIEFKHPTTQQLMQFEVKEDF